MPRRLANVLAAALATLVPCIAQADGGAGRYQDPANGFSLQPPKFAPANAFGTGSAPVLFHGPGKDAAAPACGVSISNSGMTLLTYRSGTLRYFKSQGITLLSDETRTVSGRPALLWRYASATSKALALVVYDEKRLLLVTCLAPPADFAALEPLFLAMIDSFEVESAAAP